MTQPFHPQPAPAPIDSTPFDDDVPMQDYSPEINMPQPSWTVDGGQQLSSNAMGKKRAYDAFDEGDTETPSAPTRVKARTLGGGGTRKEPVEVRVLRPASARVDLMSNESAQQSSSVLDLPPLKTLIKATMDDSANADWIEAKNGLSGEHV